MPGAGQSTKPFQIPLAALIPAQSTNILPACKNIGTTHITNGAYRLHPIEWSVGEAQGALAVLLCAKQLHIKTLSETPSILALQQLLVEQGVPVYWYEDIPTSHPQFAAIQFLGVSDIMRGDTEHLSFILIAPLREVKPLSLWRRPCLVHEEQPALRKRPGLVREEKLSRKSIQKLSPFR